jgi:hypothetical protein
VSVYEVSVDEVSVDEVRLHHILIRFSASELCPTAP